MVSFTVKFDYLKTHLLGNIVERLLNYCQAFNGEYISTVFGDADQMNFQV